MSSLIKRPSGQAMAEMAVAVPVFFLIIALIADLSFLLHGYIMVNGAAREGARMAAVGASDSEVRSRLVAYAPSLRLTAGQVSISPGDGARVRGQPVQVTVQTSSRAFLVSFIAPAMGLTAGTTGINIRGQATMRME